MKLKLVALTQQALHGPLDTAQLPPLGAFDMIGKDRRNAWNQLGQMTKEVRQDVQDVLLDVVMLFLENASI